MTDSGNPPQDISPFLDLDAYIALPRVSGLTLSPDGTRLITSVAVLDPTKTRYVTALWEVDPAGQRPARRLTRSAKGEAGAAFLPDGSVAFISARPDPDAKDSDDENAALWQLPADGGESRVIATRPGGISGVVVAAAAGTILVTSATLPGADSRNDDEKRRKDRKDRKISAMLHESYPVRYWDHDMGPDLPRLFVGPSPVEGTADQQSERVELRDISPDAGRALAFGDMTYDITRDGDTVVSTWALPEPGGSRDGLVSIDVATGSRTIVLGDSDHEYSEPRLSPDGATVAVLTTRRAQAGEAPDTWLALLDLNTGESRALTTQWDRWPSRPVWTPDGSALIVSADEQGSSPLFRIEVATGAVLRLTGDRGAYTDPQVSPDGAYVYALRSGSTLRRLRCGWTRPPRTSSRWSCTARPRRRRCRAR